MIESLVIGVGGVVFMAVAWAAVQTLWRNVFADYISDEDVLADRRSCGNCGCGTACQRKGANAAESEKYIQNQA